MESKNWIQQTKWILQQRKNRQMCYKNNGKYITRREAKKIVNNHKFNKQTDKIYGNTNTSKFGKLVQQKIKKKLY